jgi:hypothetical protein
MSPPLKLLTWATALITGFMLSGSLYIIWQHIDSGDGEPAKMNIASLVMAAAIGFSLQIGLFISPFVQGRHVLLRILSVVLMTPFVYFVLLHDADTLVGQIFRTNHSYLEDWKIDFWRQFILLVMTVACTLVYGYNIVRLIIGPSKKVSGRT